MIDKYRRFNVSTKVDIWVSSESFKNVMNMTNFIYFVWFIDAWLRGLHSMLRLTSLYGESKACDLPSHLQLPADACRSIKNAGHHPIMLDP